MGGAKLGGANKFIVSILSPFVFNYVLLAGGGAFVGGGGVCGEGGEDQREEN